MSQKGIRSTDRLHRSGSIGRVRLPDEKSDLPAEILADRFDPEEIAGTAPAPGPPAAHKDASETPVPPVAAHQNAKMGDPGSETYTLPDSFVPRAGTSRRGAHNPE